MAHALLIRPLVADDVADILALYRSVAAVPDHGLARETDEFSGDWVKANLGRPGMCFGAFLGGKLVGELHVARMGPRQFAHVLTDLTVAVSPRAQGRGVGAALFTHLFEEAARSGFTRIELFARSGNPRALALYERLGFVREGCFKGRVVLPDGTIEDDIAMARVSI